MKKKKEKAERKKDKNKGWKDRVWILCIYLLIFFWDKDNNKKKWMFNWL